MPSSFGERFLAGFREAQIAQRTRQQEEIAQAHLALDRQRLQASLAAQDAQAKAQEIERQQKDMLLQLELSKLQDRPTTEVSPEAGGVGPPAPAAPEIVSAPTHSGGRLTAPKQYRQDLEERALEDLRARNRIEVEQAVEQATAVGGREVKLGSPIRKELRISEDTKVTAAEIPLYTELLQQREANRRQAMALTAADARKDDDEPGDEQIRYMADQALLRNLEPGTLRKKTYEKVTAEIGRRGLAWPRKISDRERKIADLAEIGFASTKTMRQLYKDNPKVLVAAALPTTMLRAAAGKALGVDANIFEVSRKRAMNPEMRADTGAALNKEEQGFYGELDATLFDDPKTVEYKLRQREALYAGLRGLPVTIKMPDGKEFVVQDAFDQKQRHQMREAIRLGGEIVD